MKKSFVIILLVLSVFFIPACKTPLDKWDASLSELRDEVMTATDGELTVTLVSGVREEPFVIDGRCGERTEFTVLTLSPASASEDATYSYSLFVDGVKHEGEFNKHPFKGTWSTEIAVRTRKSATVTVVFRASAKTLELQSVRTSSMISASDALEIAQTRLKKQFKSLKSDGKFAAEIYVRLLKNPISAEEGYYWYVGVAASDTELYAVLIHPETREIVAVKE